MGQNMLAVRDKRSVFPKFKLCILKVFTDTGK